MSIENPQSDRTVADEQSYNRTRVPVAGGVLVYEQRGIGRTLIGFEDVDDWDSLEEGLAARGHGRGAIYDLDELDA